MAKLDETKVWINGNEGSDTIHIRARIPGVPGILEDFWDEFEVQGFEDCLARLSQLCGRHAMECIISIPERGWRYSIKALGYWRPHELREIAHKSVEILLEGGE